ncbi:hypothetical protein Fleli_0186 [Bernardetia litoralis DSM 6794]|uniref:Uncharacterized protein n=1 Tax=Bernardetia litoralis (strain ATCC 23117 / DSM 6794 / NBRC 15988 / NCIMB 1366 / Fx l1 / Sio-4) TaxID=880071 RepID=I4AFE9_BERLS|nr:hypothetical protein [Bernardetia litoralis]AFM02684.1 hypothetical protein Fleli_0186 [Bernardetia litoralis DSM 6794]
MSILSIVHVDLSPGLKNEFRKSVGFSLCEVLRNNFLSWKGFFKKYPNYSFCFYIITKNEVEEIEIKGPGIFKKDKEVEYSIFIPNRKYDLLSYVETVFDGLHKILSIYKVEENEIQEMKMQLLKSLSN